MSKAWVPDAGDIVHLNFNPQAGHEQAGRRWALVLSPADYNSRSQMAVVCPITTKVKGYPFEVALPDELKTTGVVLADQLRCIDWKARRAKHNETAPRLVIDTVRQYVSLVLGIKQGPK